MRTSTPIPEALRPQAPVAPVPEPAPPGRSSRWRGWIDPPEGITSLALVALILLTTVWTVEGARWVRDMAPLEPVALGGVLLGFLLAKIRVPSILLHPIAVLAGTLAVIADTVLITDGATVAERLVNLGTRMAQWWEIASTGGISSDPVPFVLQVVVLTWVVAYISSWFVFRSQQIWLGIMPSGIALLVNLTYLPERFTAHFIVYVVAAMLLASRLALVQNLRRWRREGAEVGRSLEFSFVANSLWVTAFALFVGFQTPILDAETPAAEIWEQYGGPWRDFEREFDRLFASVSSGKAVPLHSFGRQMPFRGAVAFGSNLPLGGRVNFGQDTVMTVESETSSYWRAGAYDTYTGQGWVSSARQTQPALKELKRTPTEQYEGRKEVTITVEVQSPTDVVFSAGMPLTTDVNATDDLASPAQYLLSISDPNRVRGLPADLRAILPGMARSLQSLGRLPAQDDAQRLLPPDVTVKRMELNGARVERVEVQRLEPYPPDSLGQRTPQRMNRGQKYTATSWVSEAAVEDLEKAGTEYPGWVLDRYMGLPRDVPDRVRDLAREWTEGMDTPYEKAAEIERRLRSDFTYSLDIQPPPPGRDGVEHFLFTLKRGYCDYFASAMAVMLRAQGIPARVAVGYVSGDYDAITKTYTVREPHAHAWPEVYFPKYGWVEFNPTPSWPSVWRPSTTTADSGFNPDELPGELIEPDPESMLGEVPAFPTATSDQFDPTAILLPLAYALAGMALVLLTGRTAWNWGLAGLNPAAQTYEKVSRLATLGGRRPRPEETPSEYAARLTEIVPRAALPVREIADSYARHRFSARPVAPAEAQQIEAWWRQARMDLLRRALRWKTKGTPQQPQR